MFFLLKSNAFKLALAKIDQRNYEIAVSIANKAQVFSALNIKQKYSIVKYFKKKKLIKGEILFKKGDPAKELYIVKKGKISLVFDGDNK